MKRFLAVLLTLVLLCSGLISVALAEYDSLIEMPRGGKDFNHPVSIKLAGSYFLSTDKLGFIGHNYYSFVPQETGVYHFRRENIKDASGIELYNEYGETLALLGFYDSKIMEASMELEEGKEYILFIKVGGKTAFFVCTPSAHAQLSELKIGKNPTCVTEGGYVQECEVCGGKVKGDVLPATGHTAGEWAVATPATCTTSGLSTQCCTTCGEVLDSKEIPATGHTAGDSQVTRPATCLAAGEESVFCTACGEVLSSEVVPMTDHKREVWLDIKPATCTSDGQRVQRCAVCGETLATETVPAFGHSPMAWETTREAACLQSGLREKKCAICGLTLESEQIDALGHSYTEWVTTIEATKEQEGEKTRHCINCGDTQQEKIEKIPKVLGIF